MNFSCQCGEITGVIHGAKELQNLRFICTCKDCQAYASCCRSPIANSLSSKAGYVGIIAARLGDFNREDLGPIRVRANGESGIPPLPEGTSPRLPLAWIFVTVRQILRMHLKRWKRPNPFFDDRDVPYASVTFLNSTVNENS